VKTEREARMAGVAHNVIGNPWSRRHDSIMMLGDRLDKDEANYLRDQPPARPEVVSAADDILAAMAGYRGDLGWATA